MRVHFSRCTWLTYTARLRPQSTLDVQWVMGSGQGVNTTTWSFPPGDYILNWAWAVGNYSQSPLVTSIRYVV